MKKIIVTGGFGYIGSHIVKELIKKKYTPIIIDNLGEEKTNIHFKGVHAYQQDISDTEFVQKIIETHKPIGVIHTAGTSSIAESVLNPHKYFKNNVYKLISFLEAIKDSDIKHFVYSSSGAVYGNPLYLPINEKHPTNPLNPYAYSKLVVEQMIKTYEMAYGLKHAYLRFFNATGASMDGTLGELHKPETHIIPLLIQTAMGKRKKFIINGDNYNTKDGTAIRDYVHVEDIAVAHVKALDYLIDGGKSDIFNLGISKGYSVLDLIEKISEITKLKIPYEKQEKRSGDSPILISDYTKAKEVLKWKPKYTIDDMIKSLYKWFKDNNI